MLSPTEIFIFSSRFLSTIHSSGLSGILPEVTVSRFMPSVMEYAFATRSPAHASMQYAPYSPLYVVLRPQGFNVVFGQAEGGEHLYIHELLLIQIFIAGVFHIRRCGLETGEKRYGESYEYGYGKKTVFAVFYFPYEIFS